MPSPTTLNSDIASKNQPFGGAVRQMFWHSPAAAPQNIDGTDTTPEHRSRDAACPPTMAAMQPPGGHSDTVTEPVVPPLFVLADPEAHPADPATTPIGSRAGTPTVRAVPSVAGQPVVSSTSPAVQPVPGDTSETAQPAVMGPVAPTAGPSATHAPQTETVAGPDALPVSAAPQPARGAAATGMPNTPAPGTPPKPIYGNAPVNVPAPGGVVSQPYVTPPTRIPQPRTGWFSQLGTLFSCCRSGGAI